MTFTDLQLQKCYESHFIGAGGFPVEVRQVRALIAVHDWFQMLEGPHSSRVHETMEHLLLPELRPGLRRWYQLDAEKEPVATALRDQLSQLAGERLEDHSGCSPESEQIRLNPNQSNHLNQLNQR